MKIRKRSRKGITRAFLYAFLHKRRKSLARLKVGGRGKRERINEVRPFCAEHYNPEKTGDIGLCLSRPYDVITPAEQDVYYQRHPNNVIRLILNKDEPKDDAQHNRYTRARDFLSAWREERILVSYKQPSLWVYEQEFEAEGFPRRKVSGVIGLVRLQDSGNGRILPHENVIREPLEDRIRLTRTTLTQFEYIWGIYPDSGHDVDGMLSRCDRSEPVLDHTEKTTQVRHCLWRLTNRKQCQAIHDKISGQKIYIADGHHRYQTMLTIRDELRAKYPQAGPDAPWEFIMMFLVSANHEGLTTLPTHRMLRDVPVVTEETVRRAVELGFHVLPYSFGEENEIEARETWLRELRNAEPRDHKFGVALHGVNTYYLLSIDEKKAARMVAEEGGSMTLRLLDVSLLRTLVFQRVIGLMPEQIQPQKTLHYTYKVQEALERIQSGDMQAAFFLNRTNLDEIMAVADNGEKMPQKSTYFYPKPLSGLVFYHMNKFHGKRKLGKA